jgi:hypothetical protein
VLSHGGRGDTQTFATYITPEIVCRGTWCVIQQNVCCMMHGFRASYVRRDVINLQMIYEEPTTTDAAVVLSGFATGITSHGLRPFVLPVFAVRVADDRASSDLLRIGDGCDSELRMAWYKVTGDRPSRIQMIGDVFNEVMVAERGSIVMNVGDISERVLQIYGRIDKLIDRRITSFCENFSLEAAWE